MWTVVILLSIIVITMQEIGNYLAARLDKR
jgi:hypothetical protein